MLNRDPEEVRAKEGPNLNKGILSVSNLLRDLASTPQGDYANYDESILTSLAREVFGGNSSTIGLFCLKYGDQIGSQLSMRAMKRCQNIYNFPTFNDQMTLGALRKNRVHIQKLQELANSYAF